jgi:GntR family transcriptional regulator
MFDDGSPIYLQVAGLVESQIIDGTLAAGDQVPSTNEFAAFHRINPATAAKGVNLLVSKGILYKRRGIGMFVADTARDQLLAERREHFFQKFVVPLKVEAGKLGISDQQLADMLQRREDPQ